MDLTAAKVLVAGGSKGIGKEIAAQLKCAGAAKTVVSLLSLDDRAFVPDVTEWATNPQ